MFRFRRADFYRVIAAMRLNGNLILCGRKSKTQYSYEVANFLMNVRTTFCGDQFPSALRHRVLISAEEFLAMT